MDDAQWLDRPSLGVLTFIARRLDNERIALVAAVRPGDDTPLEEARLPIAELERLSASAAAELLDRRAPGLHPIVRIQVLTEAAGNPLALVELARSLPLTGGSPERLSLRPTTLTARLEEAFAGSLHDLPSETRLALLAAALDGLATLEEVLRTASLLNDGEVSVSALGPAVERRLVNVVESEVRFRHPLIRSAVRQNALPGQVLAAYAALSSVVGDPERRLWHRAMAAPGYDGDLGAALEAYAQEAKGRGAATVAGAALERAAALTADPTTRAKRLVSAAEIAHELGLVDAARRLLQEASPLEPGQRDAARIAWLREIISGNVWVEPGATKTFVTMARRMREGGDSDLALRSLLPIAHRCWWTRTRTTTRQYLVDAAMELGMPDDDPRLLAVIALAHPEVTGKSVLGRVSRMRLSELTDPVAAMCAGIAAEKSGDFVLGVRFLARAVDGLREEIRLGPLTQALVHYAWAAAHTGDWFAADAAAAEAASLARDTRQPQYGLTAELVGALVAAVRGAGADIDALVVEPEQALLAMRAGPLLATAHLARGAAAVRDGRHDDAFRHLWPVFDVGDAAFHRFMRWPAVLDLVESGVGSGKVEALIEPIKELESIAAGSQPPILVVELGCARPLMARDDDAEASFVAAVAQDLTDYPFLHARTLFSFGRWLRRQRRSAESRTPLRRSVDMFDAVGATVWSRRARDELRATGERIGRRTPDIRDRLTAQELQIARLAATGLSNREIGQRLFLSHRTVGSHLYRIFPKLGISGRAQLRDALSASTFD